MVRNNRLKGLTIIAFTVAAMITTSCNRNTVYSRFMHTNIDGWNRTDTLLYNIGRIETSGEYERSVGVRISNNYPFKSMTIIVEQTILPHGRPTKDTLVCRFADDDGNILGNGLSLYQYEYPIDNIKVYENDSLRIRIWHGMRKEAINGVADVGVALKKL